MGRGLGKIPRGRGEGTRSGSIPAAITLRKLGRTLASPLSRVAGRQASTVPARKGPASVSLLSPVPRWEQPMESMAMAIKAWQLGSWVSGGL